MAKAIKVILTVALLLGWLWITDRSLEGTERFHEERVQQHIERCEKAKALYRLENN